jgi:6-pyruvoyltetrahydropterin/6-carboxytetrahydropterin synthase
METSDLIADLERRITSLEEELSAYKQPTYMSSKTWDHNLGLSVCFRQPDASSHCNKMHGYSLKVKATFIASELDKTNWVVDFGSLKSFKKMLEDNFDHKTIVSENDPFLDSFKTLHNEGIIDMLIYPKVGMEAFAFYLYESAESWLMSNGYYPRVKLKNIVVSEHPANSAGYGLF